MITNKNHCYIKNGQIIFKEIEGAPVLVDPYRRTLIKLDPVAAEIWKLLDGKRSVDGIIESLGGTFEVDKEELEKDVSDFIKDLTRREIVL